jgi:hypothetical protein
MCKEYAAFIASARTALPALVECLGEICDKCENQKDGLSYWNNATAIKICAEIREIISRHLSGIEVAKCKSQ